MRRALPGIVALLPVFAGLNLLYLTNTGLLSLDKAYVYRFSAESLITAQVIAFTDVTIIPVASERVLPAQAVLVRRGLVEEIGPTGQVQVPTDALVGDGADKYLMPELVDMHVHIKNANDLLLFVARGVTKVRNLWGMMDALNPYQIPGFSAHEKSAYLVRAGLSPYEALPAGTHDAVLVLGRLEESGTVSEGKRADLLLLDANPLDDVTNIGRISGVMARGRWLPQGDLESMVE